MIPITGLLHSGARVLDGGGRWSAGRLRAGLDGPPGHRQLAGRRAEPAAQLTLEMLANSASLITSSRSTSTSPTPWMTAAHHADLLVMDDRVLHEGSKLILVSAAACGELSYRPGGRWAG